MSTEISPVNNETLVPTTDLAINQADLVVAGFDENEYAGLAGGMEFLPRLQLSGATSDLAKEGKVPIGTYTLVETKEKYTDLGKQINVFILGLRLKALEISKTGDGISSFYDPKSDDFKRIANASQDRDSGCLAGPEFLVYIPSQKRFATFFMASKSMRNEAPSVKALLGKAATLQVAMAENKKKQKWHVPKTLPCTIPLDPPDQTEFASVSNKFRNPVSSKPKILANTAGEVERPR